MARLQVEVDAAQGAVHAVGAIDGDAVHAGSTEVSLLEEELRVVGRAGRQQ